MIELKINDKYFMKGYESARHTMASLFLLMIENHMIHANKETKMCLEDIKDEILVSFIDGNRVLAKKKLSENKFIDITKLLEDVRKNPQTRREIRTIVHNISKKKRR